jgi:hypothetical protein
LGSIFLDSVRNREGEERGKRREERGERRKEGKITFFSWKQARSNLMKNFASTSHCPRAS